MRHATQHDFDPVTGLDWGELDPPDYKRWCYGGGKSSPRPPPPPDPIKTAQAQGAANREATLAGIETSLINQRTPFGDLTFEQIGETELGNPQFEAVQTLSPEQQQQLDLLNQSGIRFGEVANQQLGAVSDLLGEPIDFSSVGPAPVFNEDFRAQTAQNILGRVNPQLEADRTALESRLASQGITAGSQAFNDAFRPFNQRLNDLNLAADLQAGQEAQRQFGQELLSRNQALNELTQQRQIPLNELSALLSGTQVQQPSFVSPPAASFEAPDILGATFAANNAAQNNFLARQQQDAANRAGLFGLGSAAISAAPFFFSSDRRLKRDIERIGTLASGLALYTWNYVWGAPGIGVMADEVRKVFPDAVVRIGEYDVVDYGRVW